MQKSRCLGFIVSRAASPDRLARLRQTLTEGREFAGTPCDWLLWANSPEALKVAQECDIETHGDGTNVGQHVAFNAMLNVARAEKYEYLLRVDDDADFVTRGWLRKLIEVADELSKTKKRRVVLAPRVIGLKNPIDVQGTLATKHGALQFVRITGGVCRLMPVDVLNDYVADVRQAMGAGEATSLAAYCTKKIVPMFVVPWVRLRHKTESQESADSGYFAQHSIFQAVPYVPLVKEATHLESPINATP